MFPFYIILLLASLLLGLILLAMGAILLLKVKNKITGILVGVVGLVFTFCPVAVFIFLVATVRTQG
jgi:hypothetical protein